jgi:hypothetical protein
MRRLQSVYNSFNDRANGYSVATRIKDFGIDSEEATGIALLDINFFNYLTGQIKYSLEFFILKKITDLAVYNIF